MITKLSPLDIKISYFEFLLLFLIWIIGFAVIFPSNLAHDLRTFLLLIAVTVFGLILSKNTARLLGDHKLNVLGSFWLFKVLATILLLYFGWMPELDAVSSISWGYDPQRYYSNSLKLLENDWTLDFVNLNYTGIIYYYTAIFQVAGFHPMAASLVNIFVTLYGILFLIRSAYAFAPVYSTKDWTIAWLVLIPEVLWYDVMTSRETLLAFLISSLSLIIGRKILAYRGDLMDSWLIAGVLSVAILSVRTSMIIPVSLGVILMFFILSEKSAHSFFRSFQRVIFVWTGVFTALIIIPWINNFLGSAAFGFADAFARIFSSNNNTALPKDGWGERSIGYLLLPDNPLQAVLFLPFRMILYIAAPLPKIAVTFSALLSGSYSAWQGLMVIPTSILMVLLFPHVLAGTSLAWSVRRQTPGLLIIPIIFWATFAAVAGGNLIIHERYRLMVTILFFAVTWIGYTQSNPASVKRYTLIWAVTILLMSVFYSIYKFI